MAPVAVVIGAPGAGKTTVGTALAAHLAVGFADADTLIEAAAGKPIPEIFFDEGEDEFRRIEALVIADALTTFDGVLALGGGAVLREETQVALRGHTVIYLSAQFATAISRVGLGAGRPLLSVNPRATLKHLMDQRRPIYTSVATHTVATDDGTPEEIAAEIAKLISAGQGQED